MRLISALTWAVTDWLANERDRLAMWLPVFMAAGVAGYYALRFEPAVWIGPAVAAPALLCAISLPRLRLLLAPIAAAALGFASGQIATARAPPLETSLPTHATIITGAIQVVEALPAGRRITIQPAYLDGAPDPLARAVRVRLHVHDDGPLDSGDTVRIRALIRPPSPPSYPGGWDLQRDAFYAGLGASGYALAPAERTAMAMPSAPMRRVQRLREAIAHRVTAVIPGAAGAVCVTLLTGTSMAIPVADHAAFRDSGLAHLLAVAGLHIGIVMGFALMLSRRVLALSERASLFWPTKKLAAAAALAAGGAYMVLTGMHVPIIRSFLMACLLTVALLVGRNPVSLRGLALAAALLMAIAPHEVPDVSFQMSFAAVLALIAGYEALRPWLRRLHGKSRWRRLLSHLAALALTSALAGSASAPYGAYHFGHVQVYFVLANMIAVPLTAFWVMPAGLIALGLMPLHLEALALVPMGWGAEAVLWVARSTSALPAATFSVPHMPLWGLCVFSLGLAWLGLWRTRPRLAGVPLMLAGLASPLLDRPPDLLMSADARLIALRTGQGMFLQQMQGGSKFTRDAWVQYWAIGSTKPIPAAGGDAAGIVRCDDSACLLRPYPDRPGVLLARGAPHPAGCDQVSVIVSAEPARGLCPKPWPKLADRFTVWRYGSIAIWLDPTGARVLTDRAARGDRPWVPPPPRPRQAKPVSLPPASMDHG
ncbi:ComEC/Rec2 family competence protein [Rhodopila sp.]|uniref:ComEC/Rec2 family competence protein n=1 Tax=Rhodopila sp. TaxID=2480087 RepID=UPI003D09D9F8